MQKTMNIKNASSIYHKTMFSLGVENRPMRIRPYDKYPYINFPRLITVNAKEPVGRGRAKTHRG